MKRLSPTQTLLQAPGWAPQRGTSSSAPIPLVLESHLQDEGVIGEGGMAWVHRVFDTRLERQLAMKVLKPGASAAGRARFVQETRVTARLDHPAIVPVHCAGTDEGGLPSCFTMKLVEGETLSDKLEYAMTPFRGDELADFVRDLLKVCDAIAFAHSRGVIHRDLKPENIMIGRYGQVYVMDWGIAHVRGPDAAPRAVRSAPPAEAQGEVIGTPCYMAPEQARGRLDLIDERTDIYSIGGILYEVLTLKSPHDGASVVEVLYDAQTAPVRPPELVCGDDLPPAALSDIVMKALAFDPEDRFASVEELQLALERFLYAGAWFTRRYFPKGTVVLREGERGDCAYIVESGECRIYRLAEGRDRPLRFVGPGEVFGELALTASETRTASVDAHSDVVLLEVSRDSLERELPAGSWVRHMVDTLGQRFIQYDRDLMQHKR